MGRIFLRELEGDCYQCSTCLTSLALASDLITRSQHWQEGRRPYLFRNVVNITFGSEEDRMMPTGMHTIQDVSCCSCLQILGWKCVTAQDKYQRLLEGIFVLERSKVKQGF